ncbi:hypothetical protein Pst134EA_013701 [Puccinia striiformis f. sp. tritici]|uniref:hypothetical protein n=1 Tax=Puccinia striiformis f. sp. tritici TaxID=168172 RepID=UPI0020072DB1|nr:hypothetical protein Pst134EA_013701 [Puccinia striiformis f. sp. tritici]KAH9454589.1 hypothetical protein Pst134EB_014662 [Puccinia striiformis f. sp. tritici]KAH9465836.1 hypothetical protein Pst134EA_013701 [Puccinia striiformis f. sp. tritici]
MPGAGNTKTFVVVTRVVRAARLLLSPPTSIITDQPENLINRHRNSTNADFRNDPHRLLSRRDGHCLPEWAKTRRTQGRSTRNPLPRMSSSSSVITEGRRLEITR